MTTLGFLCGFKAEAQLLKDFQHVVHGDGGVDGARRALARLPLAEIGALVSFGVAGGLQPDLKPGALLIPDEVMVDGRAVRTDPGMTAALRQKLPQALAGRMVAGSGLLATPQAKSGLWAETKALAVDLESGVLAEAALAAGLPLIIIRAVADAAEKALPSAARIPLRSNGTPNMPAILLDVLRSPAQIPRLIALAGETRRALTALESAVSALRS